jgi:hypothetical protein
MRKYITLFFSALIFLWSCKGNKNSDTIINHDRMINLLTDVHITDGSLYSVMQNPDSLRKYGMPKYLALFKRYHTDSAQFRKSMAYYSTKPDELLIMYNQIMKNLQKKTDSLDKVEQKHVLPRK